MIYLTQQQFASHRQTLGIDSIGMDGLRTLTDQHDLTMCQRLVAQFGAHESQPNWRWSAYAIGRYYLVAWRFVSHDGGFRIGLTPWIIVDEDLVQFGGFAS